MGAAQWGFSQIPQLSPQTQISLLTCGRGEDLYTTFGHSAFRINDPELGIDVVYNYGTFNFNPPIFYVDFARGKLLYSLSRAHFDDFLYEYELQNRWVKEQVLELSSEEKNELFQFLETNYLPENRDYKYDFLFDNCATKIPAVLKKVYGKDLVFQEDYLDDQYTFRELIHQNLVTNSWSSFGIDLALGSVIDRKATPYEHTFLPNYVMKQLDHTTLEQDPLVGKKSIILKAIPTTAQANFFMTPLFWILLLLTDHSSTANNFNILWAFPLNLVAAFYMFKKNAVPPWITYYLWVLLGLLVLTVVLWIFKIQMFSPVIIPILVLLAVRYIFLLKKID